LGDNPIKKGTVMRAVKILFFSTLCFSLLVSNCLADTTAVLTLTVTVLPGESSISVETNTVDGTIGFGAVSGAIGDMRFMAPRRGELQMLVSYFAASSPWHIRVFTANPGDPPPLGLVGVSDPSKSIDLKVWCENFGPAGTMPPDEENPFFWNGFDFNGNGNKTDEITGGTISEVDLGFDVNGDGDATDVGLGTVSEPVSEEPKWLRVPDVNEQLSGKPETWRSLAYSGAELETSGFPVYLGINIVGVVPQDYSTNTLTFEIIHE